MPDFTPTEKTEILRYLGYADWQSLASSVGLGYPAASQPMFIATDAMFRITDTGRDMVRRDLAELRCIEDQISAARQRFQVVKAEGVEFNQNETRKLREEKEHWTKQLADDLGCTENPYRQSLGGGGINARVIG